MKFRSRIYGAEHVGYRHTEIKRGLAAENRAFVYFESIGVPFNICKHAAVVYNSALRHAR